MTILLEDNFNDNSIDITKWQEFDPNNILTESNQKIEIIFPDSTEFVAKIENFDITTFTKLTAQVFIQGLADLLPPMAILHLEFDEDAGALTVQIISDDEGVFRLRATSPFLSYNFLTSIPTGKDVKIELDNDTKQLKFYYWSGLLWAQMGATQDVVEILTGNTIGLVGDNTVNETAGTISFDDFFATDNFYSTHYPETTPPVIKTTSADIIVINPAIIQKTVQIRKGVKNVVRNQ